MAYTDTNFKSKKQFKEAVKAGLTIRLYSPGQFAPKENGTEFVEGPHYPEPHKWYAKVHVVNGIVISVK